MRICYIAAGQLGHVDPYIGHFAERGHEVHFVALAPGPQRDVPTHNVGAGRGFFRLPGKANYLLAIVRARRLLRGLKPDIIHAHYATSAGLAAYLCGAHPYLVTAHGTDVTQGVRSVVWRRILRTILMDADCVNVVSDDLRAMVLDLGIPLSKVETFTLGIDTRRFAFAPLRARTGPMRLICTRYFKEVYDHRTLLESMAILARRGTDFRLTLVGDGPLDDQLRALAAELGIEDWTTFIGGVPNSRLPELLAGHEVYLSASRSDGTSLCLLEAMASGVYPVVSDITANRQWIRHGHNGHLHQVGNPQSLAEQVLATIQRRGDLGGAVQFNRDLVEKCADRTVNMTRLEEIYRALCRRD